MTTPPPTPTPVNSSNAYIHRLFSVAGKRVLCTGGSRGIGLLIARGFVAAGAHVLLTSRDETACAAAAAELGCSYVVSNLSTRRGCEELARRVDEEFLQPGNHRLDVLINNAGTSWGEPLDRESGKANWGWDKVLDLNVKSIFYLTRACLPLMRRSKNNSNNTAERANHPDTGTPTDDDSHTIGEEDLQEDEDDPARVINIGSVTGFVPQEAPTHAYDVSKAAVHHLTRKLSAELAQSQPTSDGSSSSSITVNCLAPGFVPSRMSAGLATWGGDAEALAAQIPLRRLGRGDDMAGACLYLASPAASWCTGVILNVDGGTVGGLQIPLSSSL